jgi:SPP1 family predicted phage head-tail adaptor
MESPDGQGGFLPTAWVEYFRFYGEVKWGGGGEKVVAGQVQASSSCTITAYFDRRLTESMRIIFNNLTLNVRNVDDIDERHQYMSIKADLGVGT